MPISNQESGIKPGTVAHFAAASAPVGWVKANGAAVSRATYAALFIAIGTTYGAGDGSTTFNLPDLRGEFMRGFDDGRGVDSGRTIGSGQAGEVLAHQHKEAYSSQIGSGAPYAGAFGSSGVASTAYSLMQTTASVGANQMVSSTGGTETRPRNVAMLACIKY